MANLTKKGARQVTADLDRIATLFQDEWHTLGIPKHIAHDFALRCDMISDAVERTAAASNGGWDPEQIGEEVGGPLVQDPDEPFMRGEFTQQEKRELRERVQSGDLGPTKTVPEPQSPTPGVQASFRGLVAALKMGGYDPAAAERALRLAANVVRQGKELPPEFLENAKKKKDEAKGDGEDEKKGGKKGADEQDEKKGEDEKDEKKASFHGYDLFAR